MTYTSKEAGLSVSMSSKALDTIIAYCITSASRETGGILVGSYSPDLLQVIVESATGPSIDSRRSRYSFKRGIKGMQKLLDYEWEKNGVFYVGEWHYHPKSSARPSNTDINQMINFSKHPGLKCPEPVLFIVGGSEGIGWKFSTNIITIGKVYPCTML